MLERTGKLLDNRFEQPSPSDKPPVETLQLVHLGVFTDVHLIDLLPDLPQGQVSISGGKGLTWLGSRV
jgi:hypothetical protein